MRIGGLLIVAILLLVGGVYFGARLSAGSLAGFADLGGGRADASHGRQLYLQTCAACHGPTATGQPHVGANLLDSKFVADETDDQLLGFIKAGRLPNDPKTVMNLPMPARGGNTTLDDRKLRDIIAYLRNVQAEAKLSAAAR